ncbi:histidine phosphatase family protein [Anaerostipes sp.]|uniref:histidine phosphatase family protein n=1 Tax=Anaerostipes sp. TaxID=1872530 RepID=UPI0025BD96FF|nr:histidine phosphatase family protein [Anaerostipes sp.]MBS7007977.1 histidine phosphatase family protein [Anaerostipes sp.]
MKKKVTFYYIRHGETLFNVFNRMQGWCDSPLTEKGISNAKEAKKMLKNISLKAAYVSTSERCRDTCAIILEGREIPTYERKGLKEVNFGTWEGVEVDKHLDEINRRRGNGIHWDDCGGDNNDTFGKRIRETYNEIYEECEDGDRILIVSHGAAWLWMQGILLGIDSGEFGRLKEDKGLTKLPNGYNGIFSCTDGQWRLEEVPGLTKEEIKGLYEN